MIDINFEATIKNSTKTRNANDTAFNEKQLKITISLTFNIVYQPVHKSILVFVRLIENAITDHLPVMPKQTLQTNLADLALICFRKTLPIQM